MYFFLHDEDFVFECSVPYVGSVRVAQPTGKMYSQVILGASLVGSMAIRRLPDLMKVKLF